MTDLSVVIPLFNEAESLPELCEWIDRVTGSNGYCYEMICIDDGSTDTSWEVISKLRATNDRIKAVRFNRNYGKSAALQTGFGLAQGKVVITMDADLQDSPNEIPDLYNMIVNDGYDLVSGWKKKRHDPITKTIPSRFFNLVTRILSGIRLHDFNCGLKAYKRTVAQNLIVYGELHRYIPLIAKWQGFNRIGEKVVSHQKRKYGKTKFGLERFIFGFLDLLTITFVSRFRKRPMHFFGTFGVLSFLFGLIAAGWLIWQKIDAIYFSMIPVKREVVEQPLFFISLVAIIIGVQLFLSGFLAELLATQHNGKKEYLIIDKLGIE